MAILVVFFATVSAVLFLSPSTRPTLAQEGRCAALGFHGGHYETGAGLSICNTTMMQCCNDSYINSVRLTARLFLEDGLRSQIRDLANRILEITNPVILYFDDSFLQDWLYSGVIPNPLNILSLKQLIEVYEDLFANVNFTREFNTKAVVDNITSTISIVTGNLLGGMNSSRVSCVRDRIQGSVDQSGVDFLNGTLVRLQEMLSFLRKTSQFFSNYGTSANIMLPDGCIQEFVEYNFCGRCTRSIPPLCSNTCGALLVGCYSAYYTVLSGEVSVLVNVSIQVIRQINKELGSLFSGSGHLLFDTNALSGLDSSCGVMFQPAISPNTSFQNQFSARVKESELRNLNTTGPFDYSRGIIACRPSDTEQQFCSNSSEDRRMENTCNLRTACTSECKCFDGKVEQRTNTQEFNSGGINEQKTNPVVNISNCDLYKNASAIGTPFSDFLNTPDTRSTLPSGIVIPPSTTFIDDKVKQCSSAGVTISTRTVLHLVSCVVLVLWLV